MTARLRGPFLALTLFTCAFALAHEGSHEPEDEQTGYGRVLGKLDFPTSTQIEQQIRASLARATGHRGAGSCREGIENVARAQACNVLVTETADIHNASGCPQAILIIS